MRAFIVLCYLATVWAKPQGYSYQQQSNSAISTGHKTTHTSSYAGATDNALQSSSSSIAQAYQQPSFLQESLDSQKVKQNSYFSPSPQIQHLPNTYDLAGSGAYAHDNNALFTPNFPTQYASQPAFSYKQQQAYLKAQENSGSTVTKDIFVHVAPQELEQHVEHRPLPQLPPRKHYRIVFIKAPSPPAAKATLQVQHAPVEEKTIIYVLTKKADPIDINAIQQAHPPKQIHKPEVYFIKYKTQEEATHAQRAIQAEYDKLGGTSQVSDEGVAPVASVIGAFDHLKQHNNAAEQHNSIDLRFGSTGSASNSANDYLPPFKRTL